MRETLRVNPIHKSNHRRGWALQRGWFNEGDVVRSRKTGLLWMVTGYEFFRYRLELYDPSDLRDRPIALMDRRFKELQDQFDEVIQLAD